jgi:hypothetical protein
MNNMHIEIIDTVKFQKRFMNKIENVFIYFIDLYLI